MPDDTDNPSDPARDESLNPIDELDIEAALAEAAGLSSKLGDEIGSAAATGAPAESADAPDPADTRAAQAIEAQLGDVEQLLSNAAGPGRDAAPAGAAMETPAQVGATDPTDGATHTTNGATNTTNGATDPTDGADAGSDDPADRSGPNKAVQGRGGAADSAPDGNRSDETARANASRATGGSAPSEDDATAGPRSDPSRTMAGAAQRPNDVARPSGGRVAGFLRWSIASRLRSARRAWAAQWRALPDKALGALLGLLDAVDGLFAWISLDARRVIGWVALATLMAAVSITLYSLSN